MRILAACSLGGSGHLNPLVPFLAAGRRRGHETLVIGPPALRDLVEQAGYAFEAGGEPPEAEVAPIRERLPVAPPLEASTLGNRELFGRLAARAMLPAMARVCADWSPDVILRDPCEYASAVVAPTLGIPTAEVAISLAAAEAGSIAVAAPALEEHRPGLVARAPGQPLPHPLPRLAGSVDVHHDGPLPRARGPSLRPCRTGGAVPRRRSSTSPSGRWSAICRGRRPSTEPPSRRWSAWTSGCCSPSVGG